MLGFSARGLILSLLVVSAAASGAVAQELLYALDENAGGVAVDSSGNGNDGTLVGGPVWIPGVDGSALSFDGLAGWVDSGYSSNLPTWTVALWVRSPAAPANAPATGPIHRERNFALSWDHPKAAFRGAAALSVSGSWYSASFGSLAPNTWHHLAATYDGETLIAYRDGVAITANPLPSGPSDPESVPMVLGRHAVGAQFFTGDVDDVRIHGLPLNANEILALASPGFDATPPVIANVAKVVSETATLITWDTDEPATSDVSFGTDVGLGSQTSDPALVTSHSVILNGLTADTTYYFQVSSQDESGNLAVDDNLGAFYSFQTLPPASGPVLHYPFDEGMGNVAADVSGNGGGRYADRRTAVGAQTDRHRPGIRRSRQLRGHRLRHRSAPMDRRVLGP